MAVLITVWSVPPDAWALINRNHIFEELGDQTLPTPTENTAVIVFFLPYELDKDVGRSFIPFVGSPVGKNTSLIYDVTTGTPKLAGAIKANTKFAYVVPAGKYLFQSIGLLEANVVGGKTYYVLVVEPLMARFASKLYPVRNSGEGEWQYSNDSFKKYLGKAVLVETTHKAYKEFEKKSALKRQSGVMKKYLEEWETYSDSERQKLTLNPEDGILLDGHSKQNTQNNQGAKTQSSVSESREPNNSASHSYSKDLEALEALRDDGIFSEEEFERQKSMLLEKEQQ